MARSNFRSGRGAGRGHQGRGFSRGGSNGGRGRGDGSNSNRSTYTKSAEKVFGLYYPGKPQTVTFDTVKEAIVMKIQTEFTGAFDVAMSLKHMKKVDLDSDKPTLKTSKNEAEQAAFNIDYTVQTKLHQARVEDLRKGLTSAYALIYDKYCTDAMRDKLQKEPDFESAIVNDPIALLKAIQTLSQTSSRGQYPIILMDEAFANMMNFKQYDNESLLEYSKRFKHCRDVLQGPSIGLFQLHSLKAYKDNAIHSYYANKLI